MQVHDHELIVSTIVNLVIWFGVSELVTNPLLALILHGIVPSLAVCLLVPLLKREMTPEFLDAFEKAQMVKEVEEHSKVKLMSVRKYQRWQTKITAHPCPPLPIQSPGL